MSRGSVRASRLGAAFVTVLLAVAIAGCGSSGSTGGDGGSSPSTQGSVNGPTSAGAASSDVVSGSTGASDMAALEEAAKKEGSVVFFGGQDEETLQALQTGFSKKYGIKVEYQHLATGEMTQVIERQWDANKVAFDVALATDESWLQSDTAKGRWATIDYDLPYLSKIPDNLRHDTYVTTGIAVTALPYNTTLVPEADAPKSFDDLLKPTFKDSIALVKPEVALSIASVYYQWMEAYGDGFEDFVDKLFAQGARLVDSGGPASQQVAAGEYKVAVGVSLTFVKPLMDKGAPIAYTVPPHSAGNVRTAETPVGAPHPNAAKLFINWLLSPDGQDIINGGSSAAPFPGASPNSIDLPDTIVLSDQNAVAEKWDYINEVINAAAARHS